MGHGTLGGGGRPRGRVGATVLIYFKAAGRGGAHPQDTPSGCSPGADGAAGMDEQTQLQATAKSGPKWKASQKKWGEVTGLVQEKRKSSR